VPVRAVPFLGRTESAGAAPFQLPEYFFSDPTFLFFVRHSSRAGPPCQWANSSLVLELVRKFHQFNHGLPQSFMAPIEIASQVSSIQSRFPSKLMDSIVIAFKVSEIQSKSRLTFLEFNRNLPQSF
jgi:hypothetical protein